MNNRIPASDVKIGQKISTHGTAATTGTVTRIMAAPDIDGVIITIFQLDGRTESAVHGHDPVTLIDDVVTVTASSARALLASANNLAAYLRSNDVEPNRLLVAAIAELEAMDL